MPILSPFDHPVKVTITRNKRSFKQPVMVTIKPTELLTLQPMSSSPAEQNKNEALFSILRLIHPEAHSADSPQPESTMYNMQVACSHLENTFPGFKKPATDPLYRAAHREIGMMFINAARIAQEYEKPEFTEHLAKGAFYHLGTLADALKNAPVDHPERVDAERQLKLLYEQKLLRSRSYVAKLIIFSETILQQRQALPALPDNMAAIRQLHRELIEYKTHVRQVMKTDIVEHKNALYPARQKRKEPDEPDSPHTTMLKRQRDAGASTRSPL